MDNSIVNKLIKKINPDVGAKFKLSDTKTYSFVPLDIYNGILYVVITKNSDKGVITTIVSSVAKANPDFISLNATEQFEILYDTFAKAHCEKSGIQFNKFSMSYAAKNRNAAPAPMQKEENLDISDMDEDINIDDDFDDLSS